MIQHDIKLALRYMWKRRIYSSIIIMSLSLGFACANILISFLISEVNTDSFLINKDRTFQVFSNDPFDANKVTGYIPDYLYDYITSNYSEVESMCQIGDLRGAALITNAGEFNDLTILSVDSSFFQVFNFPVYAGSAKKSLDAGNIILTKEKAFTLFGETDIVGKMVTIKTSDTTRLLTVSAVVDKAPENSHLIFDALVHHSVLSKKGGQGASYVVLTRLLAAEGLQSKINKDARRPGLLGNGAMNYVLRPITNSYFDMDNKMPYVKTRNPMFIRVGYIVCGLILFMASFNFINLFLLSWQSRKKEIGIKKTLGISPANLFRFSLVEVTLYISIAYTLSLVATSSLLPLFNTVIETNLSFSYLTNVKVISAIGFIVFMSGAVVVLVSVIKQWSMKPVSLMQQVSGRSTFNKVLFTSQFIVAITLAICAVTVIEQMYFIENAALGFNRNIIQLSSPDSKTEGLLAIKQKALQISGVHHATVCSGNPISGNNIIRYDLKSDQFYTAYLFNGDDDLVKTLDLTLLSGELLAEGDSRRLVNETLVHQFNMLQPIGDFVPGTKDRIAGVVKDFTCSSFKQQIPPVIISYNNNARNLLIDYNGNDLTILLPLLQKEWKSIYPDQFFRYHVIQQDLIKKYKEDTFFYKVIVAFSVISMVICCFGLFALSWAVIQSRTKEMGIRKVLGAMPLDIVNLITLTFTKRIALAFMIAAPIGYYVMNQWLMRFANRIHISAGIFITAAVLVTIVALLTLSMQTIKAAMTNPVEELKNE